MVGPKVTVTLQTKTKTPDGMGGWTEDWSDSGSFRAVLTPIRGPERLAADKLTVYATHRLYCDHRAIVETNRIKYGERIFDIKFVSNPFSKDTILVLDLLERK